MENKKTISVFSAELQKETPHVLSIDGFGEIVLTCEETGRFLKFPKGTTAEELKALLETHKTVNNGQISTAAIEAEEKKLLEALS